MDELLLLRAGRSVRLDAVLDYALDGLSCREAVPDEPLQNRKLVFAAALDEFGPGEALCRLLRALREKPDRLEGSAAVLLADGAGELDTKDAARALVLAANRAG